MQTSRTFRTLTIAALAPVIALLSFASGCAVEIPDTDQYSEESLSEVTSESEALCENRNGLNSAMTAIAVAAGTELRRWQPLEDFRWNSSSGRLELTSTGRSRCSDRTCVNTQAALALQNAPDRTVQFPGNIYLDARVLRDRLKTNFSEQQACAKSKTCTQASHDLKYTNWEFGSCEVKYFYDVYQSGKRITDTKMLDALKNGLVFLGYPENKMLNFYVRNGQVSVDPTGGLNEGGTTSAGSCTVACVKYSSSSLSGKCCYCNGRKGTYARSSFNAFYYLCR